MKCKYCGETLGNEDSHGCMALERKETPTDKSPREAEIEEIRELNRLGFLYVSSAKPMSESDLEKFNKLSEKYSPIDIVGLLLDAYLAVKQELDEARAEIAHLSQVLHKIAEAERMGYGTQRTYGEMAQRALEADTHKVLDPSPK